MFWKIFIIVAVIVIVIDILKWFSKGIDSIGKGLGLSEDQTNSDVNL